MNMTPTFSHGILRSTNGPVDDQKTNRILRYYSNSDVEVPRPWGREYETFFRVDTRMDAITQATTFDFVKSWFNPQLAWGHRVWSGHYYKVLHDTQYKSAGQNLTVGGYYPGPTGEYIGGNKLDEIFYRNGFTFSGFQSTTRDSDINCMTWEIMAGADTFWPNCGGNGLPVDRDDDTTVPDFFWPGVQFDFKYPEFNTVANSKDFQIVNFYLYFLDEEDKVTRVKMAPEKSSGYLFRDRINEETKDNSMDAWGQQPNGTLMRLWATGFSGMSIIKSKFLKISITAYVKGASRDMSAFSFNISNLEPLASSKKIPDSYLIKSKADLSAEDPGKWPGY